jgi:AraC family transcriptional regulator of adaptative response/methylated-DNA-[protein]-cysteine methyltransferase
MLSFEKKYKAVLEKDSSFEGIFVVAVKTTGVFCRPTCNARKPKAENVVFFDSAKEALLNGFRPCKLCKPLEHPGETPEYIKTILDEINKQPHKKIKDFELRQKGIDPSKIRRWFKKHHNMTFHSYQRMIRINGAFQKISTGGTITESAFGSGYESLSGFNDRYQSIFGNSPTKAKDKNVINIIRFTTPLGPMFGCATSEGVCLAEFTDRRMLEREFKDLCRLFNAVILPGTNRHLEQLQCELNEYFEGKRKSFDVALSTPGTDFQKRVWKALQEIPYGETVSYKQQAIKLNNRNGVRAVASANGYNRIAIIIPCHRVIGENGSLTGYGGGLARKKWLIDFERENSGKEKQITLSFYPRLTQQKLVNVSI